MHKNFNIKTCLQLADCVNSYKNKYLYLQHFPLFRESDKSCTGDDTAPDKEKEEKFRENWNCLSESLTRLLLNLLRPRLIMSGHTHHGCLYNHSQVKLIGD